ncbi:hypothetical protein BofuT4_uP033810.1 [Botrytis cinerea T4]|uniref:Secreted protein n=1 Tax=Botryotinia fuckeliana (strain T4) TaxID=999810 RepID=G2Y811_BOTF4|nr:hypothetical protein BofuT4_uP033810.1 [Botrytis cinerea T4]
MPLLLLLLPLPLPLPVPLVIHSSAGYACQYLASRSLDKRMKRSSCNYKGNMQPAVCET